MTTASTGVCDGMGVMAVGAGVVRVLATVLAAVNDGASNSAGNSSPAGSRTASIASTTRTVKVRMTGLRFFTCQHQVIADQVNACQHDHHLALASIEEWRYPDLDTSLLAADDRFL